MPHRAFSCPRAPTSVAVALLLSCLHPMAQGPHASRPQSAAVVRDTIPLDLTVLDREGRPPDTLAPSDLSVSVDGSPRRVVWLRRVSRGPGAMADAAARSQRQVAPGIVFAAEPSRTVLVVVDSATVARGGEWEVRAAISPLLDRLGLSDQLAVLSVPLQGDQALTFSADQPTAREAVAALVGQGGRATARADASGVGSGSRQGAGGLPEREQASDTERPSRGDDAPIAGERNAVLPDPDGGAPPRRDSAAALSQAMLALSKVPGRKTVVFVSGGLPESSAPLVSQAAARAVAARAVVHVLRLRGSAGTDLTGMDPALLERLARATGGVVVPLESRPEGQIERWTRELGATFVAGLERTTADVAGRTAPVRVSTARRDLVVRYPYAWPVEPLADEDAPPPSAPAAAAPGADGRAGDAALPVTRPSATNPDFPRAFGRLIDYVDSYVERSSVLVAEEDYRQSHANALRKVHLRSDVLIVKPERSLEWVAFRDVFEVDGFAVRDREDRLRRIFLDAQPGAEAQLAAIKAESARFNIGPVDRNVNVPYFALKFLSAANRERFRFQLKGTPTVEGVKTWRVEFEEVARPTLVRDRNDGDVPYDGWFLVDQATGAVVQSGMTAKRQDLEVSIIVTFARDSQLGLWVPGDMAETYRVKHPQRTGAWIPDDVIRGNARYTRFRRFQVKTETNLAIPK